jgi:H+/Cl- antiporter ClcA
VIGGLAGGLFSQFVIVTVRGLPGGFGKLLKKRPVVLAIACGLGVALCGFVSGDLVYGTGYEQVKTAIESGTPLPDSFGILKLLATALTAASGIPGGIFAPSLAVGAGIGSNVAQFFQGAPVGPIILLGMVAYFAGVVQAPITAFVIVTEMTDNHAMVVPVMAASLIAYVCSRAVCPEGIYHALAKEFLRGHKTVQR